MSSRLPYPTLRLVPLVLVPLALSACAINLDAARYTDREERHFTVSGTPDVVLSTFDGAIEVRAWDKPEVMVTVEKQAESVEAAKAIKVRFDQAGNRITVEVEKPEPFSGIKIGINTSRSAKLTVSVPRQSNLQARSGDGSIRLNGISGTIDVKSGDGAISGTALDGDLTVRTGDGSVTLEDVKGRLELATGDGSLEVRGALSKLRAHTGDGSVTVRALAGSRTDEDWDLTSGDGPMTLELPADFAADVDAHTGDGGITVEGLSIAGGGPTGEHHDDLKGQLGAGGKVLKLRTGDGPIRLRRS